MGRSTRPIQVPFLKILAAALVLVSSGGTCQAQNTKNEVWPELDVYVNLNQVARIIFVDALNHEYNGGRQKGNFSYYFDLALKPFFRRELRTSDDVFKRRYLSFRTGSRYSTNLGSGGPGSEHRAIAEVTARYRLPLNIILADRNRGELRFIKGERYSIRYRNRLRAERDIKLARVILTPFGYGELDYETRYGAWTANRVALGIQIPLIAHTVLETFVLRKDDPNASPRVLHALCLTLNLYF